MISKDAFISALEEVDTAILAALPKPRECSFQFSSRFEQKMRSIIRRGNHPVMYKSLQRVACVLLVLLMLFSTVMIFSTDVRAAVIGWIREQYETFYHYFFPTEAEISEPEEYTLGWVPDGFTLVNTQSTNTRNTSLYVGPENQIIHFTYQTGTNSGAAFFDTESYMHEETNIGLCRADLYLSITPEDANGIVWSDPDGKILFSISAQLDKTELIKIAEGITRK